MLKNMFVNAYTIVYITVKVQGTYFYIEAVCFATYSPRMASYGLEPAHFATSRVSCLVGWDPFERVPSHLRAVIFHPHNCSNIVITIIL